MGAILGRSLPPASRVGSFGPAVGALSNASAEGLEETPLSVLRGLRERGDGSAATGAVAARGDEVGGRVSSLSSPRMIAPGPAMTGASGAVATAASAPPRSVGGSGGGSEGAGAIDTGAGEAGIVGAAAIGIGTGAVGPPGIGATGAGVVARAGRAPSGLVAAAHGRGIAASSRGSAAPQRGHCCWSPPNAVRQLWQNRTGTELS